jgi:hypothetical protein
MGRDPVNEDLPGRLLTALGGYGSRYSPSQ